MSIFFQNNNYNNIICYCEESNLKIPVKIPEDVDLTLRNDTVFIIGNNKNLIINNHFFKKVLNVSRYNFVFKNKKYYLEKIEDENNINYYENENLILFILESPHKNEYKLIRNQINKQKTITEILPIAPASRTTGNNLNLYLQRLLRNIFSIKNNLLNKNEYKIIIANPVPYQCSLSSLYKKPKKLNQSLRDAVWIKFWNNKIIKKDFDEILNKLCKSNSVDLIINACTGGLSNIVSNDNGIIPNKRLNNIFIRYLTKKFKEILPIIANTNHPSSWPDYCYYTFYCNNKIGDAIKFNV